MLTNAIIKKALICQRLVEKDCKVAAINRGIDNKNFLIKDKSSKFFLKIYSAEDESEVQYEVEILNQLKASIGARQAYFPIILSGPFYINGQPSVLFNFIHGGKLYRNAISQENIGKIASKQAEIHRALANYKPRNQKIRYHIFDPSFVDQFVDKNLRDYSRLKAEAEVIFREGEPFKKMHPGQSIIHEDLTTENIIIGEDNVSFVDFSDSHQAEKISDIGTAIKELIIGKLGLNLDLIQTYLDSYQQILPIESSEIMMLSFLFKRRALFMLSYLVAKKNRTQDERLVKRINHEAILLEKLKKNQEKIKAFLEGYCYEKNRPDFGQICTIS